MKVLFCVTLLIGIYGVTVSATPSPLTFIRKSATAGLRLRIRTAWTSEYDEIDSITTFLSKSVGAVCPKRKAYLRHLGDIVSNNGQEISIVDISGARDAKVWTESTSILARGAWVTSEPPSSPTVLLHVALINAEDEVVGKESSTPISPGLGGGCDSRTMAIITVHYDNSKSRYSFSVRAVEPPPSARLRIAFKWRSPVSELDSGARFLGTKRYAKCRGSSYSDYIDGLADDSGKSGSEEGIVKISKALEEGKWNGSVRIPLFAHWTDEYAVPGSSLATVSVSLSNDAGEPLSGNVTRAIYPGPPGTCPGRRVANVFISFHQASGKYSMRLIPVESRPPPPETLRMTFSWRGRFSDLDAGAVFAGREANKNCAEEGPFVVHLGNDYLYQGQEVVLVALRAARQAELWNGRHTEVKLQASWNGRFNNPNESVAIVNAAVYRNGNERVTPVLSCRILPGTTKGCPNALRTVGTLVVQGNEKTGKYRLSVRTRPGPDRT